jgi:hypothetical protein
MDVIYAHVRLEWEKERRNKRAEALEKKAGSYDGSICSSR